MEIAQQNSGWLTAGEAAQYLKVKPRTLLLWVRQGKVKAFALSGGERLEDHGTAVPADPHGLAGKTKLSVPMHEITV